MIQFVYRGIQMKKFTFKKLILMIVIILLISASLFFAGVHYASNSKDPQIDSTLIQNELKEVSELITTDYSYSRIGKYKNSLDLNGWKVPLTEKNFILTYSGHIKLGVNLEQADIHMKNTTIEILLPPVTVLTNIIDEESIEVYDESNNIFNPIQIEDYKNFTIKEKEEARKEAEEKGLYQQAQEKTISSIKTLLHPLEDKYTIDIQFKEE